MIESEFKEWWEDFKGRFPAKAKSLGSPETLKTWADVLSDVSLDSALWASRSLQDGSEAMPQSWDMIPARVRQIARRLAYEDVSSAESSVECSGCGDTGIFRVDDTPKGRMAIVCDCKHGERHRKWIGKDLALPVRREPAFDDWNR